MGRKKVDTENLELEMDEAIEAEGLEAADDESDESEEVEVSADDDADEEEEKEEKKKPARKPRARKPRAKKAEPSLLGNMSKPVDEEKVEAEPEVTEVAAIAEEASEEISDKPAKPRAKRVTKAEQEEADTIGKPWVAVKEISGSISSNLERVNQMLREIPQQELFRPPVAKPAAITKVAVGMSFFAIVLSLVSLLLSQSARQVALERISSPTSAVVHATPTAPIEPKQLAFESMLPKRKPQRSTRPRTR